MDDIDDRMKQIEEEAQRIRDMQSEVEKQFQTSTTSSSPMTASMSIEEKMLIDSRSIYVGNVCH
jgi:polyadenylate-binding protein 2